MIFLDIFDDILEIFDRCPGYIWWLSSWYFVCVMEIFGWFPEDIWSAC